jgi:tRNA-dihydrouridine synthase
VVGNGDVKSVADYQAMKQATACDAVMIGRAARGNPWLFAQVLALEQGRGQPASPGVAERRAVWHRHAELVKEYAAPKMVLHELRKTLAWYSRGLHGGAELRHRCFAEPEPANLITLGESFFARLAEREAASADDLHEPPRPLADKWLAKHARRRSGPPEENGTCEG